MVEGFKIFFERRQRNPLRKQSLEGGNTNRDWVEWAKDKLPPEKEAEIQKMEEIGVDPSKIEAFRQRQLKAHEKNLRSDFYRDKIQKPSLIMKMRGISVFTDRYASVDFTRGNEEYGIVEDALKNLVNTFRDILPNRKPKFIITDTTKNPVTKNLSLTGRKGGVRGAQRDRLIYINQRDIKEFEVWRHEYAHFLADRVPRQVKPFLKEEYEKMLDSFMSKEQREPSQKQAGPPKAQIAEWERLIKNAPSSEKPQLRKEYQNFLDSQPRPEPRKTDLTGLKNEGLRNRLAERMGLPTPYSALNFDEWFAEVIAHWKDLPNNVRTYRLKTIMKKVISRL